MSERSERMEINSTDMFGVSVARVDGFRSQPTVNTDEDMVRVVLDMPKGAWRKLKSIIPPPVMADGRRIRRTVDGIVGNSETQGGHDER